MRRKGNTLPRQFDLFLQNNTMKVFILLSVVAVAFASRQCGDNQHYESCGTACPLTCENYANPPRACILMCNPGCHCDQGYVKTQDGRCVRPDECPATAEPLVKTCLGEPETGMCRGYFPMWYYDVQTGKCSQFIYGGCQGNGNRYTTEEECLQHCGGARQQASAEQCELPAVTGPCRGFFRRFYFDKQTGQCQKFVYGGCGGNENNFETEDVCNQVCGAQQKAAVGLCQLPAETGPCRGYFPRYYFDQATGKCEKFVYGGCRGNENNFETEEDCKQLCA